MFSQPSPYKRLPASFFAKKRPKWGEQSKILHLENLENRNTPAVGITQPLLPIPEPLTEAFHIGSIDPLESLDLVGETSDFQNDSIQEIEPESDGCMEPTIPVVVKAPAEESPEEAIRILVDMGRKVAPKTETLEPMGSKIMDLELGIHGRVTADHRAFATFDSTFHSRVAQSSQFLIRPGIVKPIMVPSIEKPKNSTSQLIAWGAVMASGAAHLASTIPSKRRLTVETSPVY